MTAAGSFVPSGTPPRRGPLLVAAACFALAAWWLARPGAPVRELTIAVVDGSASVTRARASWRSFIRAEVGALRTQARERGDGFGLVECGAGARFVAAPPDAAGFDPTRWQSQIDAPASELARGLALARGAFELAGTGGRVVLWTDGATTDAGWSAEVSALAGAGVRLEQRQLPPLELPDARLAALRVPDALAAGEALGLRADVDWSGPVPDGAAAELELQASVANARGEIVRSDVRTVALAAAGSSAAAGAVFDLGPLPRGWHRVEVAVRAAGDPIPENDRRARWVHSGGGKTVILLHSATDRPPPAWFDFGPGIDVIAEHVEGPANEGEGAWQRADVTVLWDVPWSRLRSPAELRARVRAGMGLLAFGGWTQLADWRARPQADDGLAPLAPGGSGAPPRDVVLLIDGSGSMAGEPYDEVRRAVRVLLERVPPKDAVSMRFFTAGLGREVELRGAGEDAGEDAGERAQQALLERPPGGPTDIVAAIDELARERAGRERPALVLLVSDGRDAQARDAQERALARAALAGSGGRLAVFAMGAQAERESLRAWLAPGEELQQASDGPALARLFERELAAEATRAGPLAARSVEPEAFALGSPLAELAAALPAPGELERIWLGQARAGASVLWRAPDGEPLLALTGYGLGWSAGIASRPGPGWASAWGEDARRFRALLAFLARGTERDPARDLRLRRERSAAGRLEWVLTPVPSDWPARVWARPAQGGGGPWLLEVDPRDARGRRGLAPAAGATGDASGALLELFASGDERERGSPLASVPADGAWEGEFAAPARVLAGGPVGDSVDRRARQGRPRAATAPALGLGLGLLLVALVSRRRVGVSGGAQGDQDFLGPGR